MSVVRLTVNRRIMPEDLLVDLGTRERSEIVRAMSSVLADTPRDSLGDADLVAEGLFHFDDTWEQEYEDAGLKAGWLERARQVRVRTRADFFTIDGFDAIAHEHAWVEGVDGLVRGRPPGRVLGRSAIYTLALSVQCARRPSTTTTTTTTRAAVFERSAVRPADATSPELAGLADYLAPRLDTLPGGRARLKRAPLLAPVAAMVASVFLVMRATSRMNRKRRLCRHDVLEACLDALDLGAHRRTAERIVRRDDPEHLHVDAWTEAPSAPVDEHVAPSEIREGFGLFGCKGGSLGFVSRAERRDYLPRVLFSLAGSETL